MYEINSNFYDELMERYDMDINEKSTLWMWNAIYWIFISSGGFKNEGNIKHSLEIWHFLMSNCVPFSTASDSILFHGNYCLCIVHTVYCNLARVNEMSHWWENRLLHRHILKMICRKLWLLLVLIHFENARNFYWQFETFDAVKLVFLK